jgi:hypothetical protein
MMGMVSVTQPFLQKRVTVASKVNHSVAADLRIHSGRVLLSVSGPYDLTRYHRSSAFHFDILADLFTAAPQITSFRLYSLPRSRCEPDLVTGGGGESTTILTHVMTASTESHHLQECYVAFGV